MIDPLEIKELKVGLEIRDNDYLRGIITECDVCHLDEDFMIRCDIPLKN